MIFEVKCRAVLQPRTRPVMEPDHGQVGLSELFLHLPITAFVAGAFVAALAHHELPRRTRIFLRPEGMREILFGLVMQADELFLVPFSPSAEGAHFPCTLVSAFQPPDRADVGKGIGNDGWRGHAVP